MTRTQGRWTWWSISGPRTGLPMLLVVAAVAAVGSRDTRAEDAYFIGNVRNLEFTQGELPNPTEREGRWGSQVQASYPYAVLDGEGEVYIVDTQRGGAPAFFPYQNGTIALRGESGRGVRGTLFWPKGDETGMVQLRFRVRANQFDTEEVDFLEARASHFQRLVNKDRPGAAWFRHQLRETNRELGRDLDTGMAPTRRVFRNRGTTMEETYSLLSGGRALSENLQLDRVLPEAEAARETVELDSITGITVEEFDWEAMLSAEETPLDPLAKFVPDDQHVIFFADFASMVRVVDNASEEGAPILNLAEPRAENARTQERYEQQLGLSLHAGARLLGGRLIRSIAFTGSDPYLRTGSDVAVIFEAVNPQALEQAVVAQVAAATGIVEGVSRSRDGYSGVSITRFRTPEREVSSYIAVLGSAVVVTNSPVQMQILIDVHQGKQDSIASLDEYKFFRQRYALGDETEDAFLFLSDKTIRRWCGPKWRIATSRRARALAVMSELQAQYLERLVLEDVAGGEIYAADLAGVAGDLRLTPSGIASDTYGSMDFLTPIAELDIDRVTEEEAQLYRRWRDAYQGNWNRFFDPNALRIQFGDEGLTADLSVMPLIARSRYNEFIEISQGATLESGEGDPHEDALLHIAMALNTDSPTVQRWSNMLRGFTAEARLDPLGWIGDTIAIYIDKGEFWSDWAESEDGDFNDFLEREGYRMPIAAYFEVENSFKLTAFLTVFRGFIEQSNPGMTLWETLEHAEHPYVRVSPSERARRNAPDGWDNAAVYYVVLDDGLLVTLNQELLHRAIDRGIARSDAADGGEAGDVAATYPWLGENLSAHVTRDFVEGVASLFEDNYEQQMRLLCWKNLEILNVWRDEFPGQDPVALHERYWQVQLVCPGGGTYRWNEEWQTMESTVFGHPGEPTEGAQWPSTLRDLHSAGFGITFEENGLRAKIELEKE